MKNYTEFLNEKVNMEELEFFLQYHKKKNPGKKVTYTFTADSPKGYTILVDGKVLKETDSEFIAKKRQAEVKDEMAVTAVIP